MTDENTNFGQKLDTANQDVWAKTNLALEIADLQFELRKRVEPFDDIDASELKSCLATAEIAARRWATQMSIDSGWLKISEIIEKQDD